MEPEKSQTASAVKFSTEKPASKETKNYEFFIAGVPYKLKTTHDDHFVQELVQFVNDRILQSLEASKNGSFQNAAVLTALNIAEELILLKQRTQRDLQKIEDKALRLAQDLERSKMNSLNNKVGVSGEA